MPITETIKKVSGQKLLSKIQAGFDPSDPTPKYFQIQRVIKSQIVDGNLKPGDEIPSVYRLADTFNITRVTADRALYELEKEHLVRRIRGRGTFVDRPRKQIQEAHLAAVFIPVRGHLFGEFARYLIRVVKEAGFHALVHDISDPSPQELLEEMERSMAADMGTFIIDGTGENHAGERIPFDRFPDSDEKTVIFISQLETSLPFPNAFKVLQDFEAGGYMVIKHLLDLGHKKILFYSHPIQPEPYFLIHSLLKGMYRAFEEKGLDGRKALVIKTDNGNISESNINGLARIFSGPHRPTAAFAFHDFRARNIFSAARDLNMSVPDDLAVAGYSNTPWCEMFPVPMTSVSIEMDKIADGVRDILLRRKRGEKITEKYIMVKPRLVVRESTGVKIHKEETN